MADGFFYFLHIIHIYCFCELENQENEFNLRQNIALPIDSLIMVGPPPPPPCADDACFS